jgi:two-component system, LytTR family, sensor histidine kinase AlgZ
MSSINQNGYTRALPDFRNLGIVLRILLIVNLCALCAALLRAHTLRSAWDELLDISVVLQPLQISALIVLISLSRALRRLPYFVGAAVVIALVLVLNGVFSVLLFGVSQESLAALSRHMVLAPVLTGAMLAYFDLRARALSPAIVEARLQALHARIRPHFLYNSLNTVLSLIRQEPKRAETALENLADMFRIVMAENRELAPIRREVELGRQYLDLEQLRLGERLRVTWRIDDMPSDALLPPLILQPLLENAVYHGIEPRVAPGEITIDIRAARGEIHAVLRNPYSAAATRQGGNKMALNNIRERLQLHFDAEATLEARVRDGEYEVRLTVPYVKAGAM